MKLVVSARDYLASVKQQIREETAQEAAERLAVEPRPVVLDVREREEYEQGLIPGSIHIPRGNLETRIESRVPDRSTPLIIYCATGTRSVYAAKTLAELGYTDVVSMAGGFSGWKQNGHDWTLPRTLTPGPVRALQPPRAHPRGGRGGPAAAARLEGAPDRRGRARLAGRRSTWRRPASARSASSTPTSSTS